MNKLKKIICVALLFAFQGNVMLIADKGHEQIKQELSKGFSLFHLVRSAKKLFKRKNKQRKKLKLFCDQIRNKDEHVQKQGDTKTDGTVEVQVSTSISKRKLIGGVCGVAALFLLFKGLFSQ